MLFDGKTDKAVVGVDEETRLGGLRQEKPVLVWEVGVKEGCLLSYPTPRYGCSVGTYTQVCR